MRKKVIYYGSGYEITARELLFSVIIVFVMMAAGFFLCEKISSDADEKSQEYEQAAKIDSDKELFEYGMRTNIGNSFVYGSLKAVDPVSLPEIKGEYAVIRKTEERYAKHEKTVTDYDEDGKACGSHTETYYTWDAVGHKDYKCSKIAFLENEFDYGTIPFPAMRYLDTIKESSKVRYVYDVCDKEYTGTIYAFLGNNTVSNAKFINGKGVDTAVESMCAAQQASAIVFWIVWIILTGISVYGFCYLDNRWVEG